MKCGSLVVRHNYMYAEICPRWAFVLFCHAVVTVDLIKPFVFAMSAGGALNLKHFIVYDNLFIKRWYDYIGYITGSLFLTEYWLMMGDYIYD